MVLLCLRRAAAPASAPQGVYFEKNNIEAKNRGRPQPPPHPLLTVCSLPGPTDTMVIFTPRSASILST